MQARKEARKLGDTTEISDGMLSAVVMRCLDRIILCVHSKKLLVRTNYTDGNCGCAHCANSIVTAIGEGDAMRTRCECQWLGEPAYPR